MRWFVAAAVVGALLYLGASVYAGFDEMRSAFSRFAWGWLPVLVALTLTNYGLRFAKWHYLLRRLGVDMPLSEDLWNFLSGLAMVISPGKLGEPQDAAVAPRRARRRRDRADWAVVGCRALGLAELRGLVLGCGRAAVVAGGARLWD